MARRPYGWKLHSPATRALCAEKVATANARGRANWGSEWAPDILPCDQACERCQAEVASTTEQERAA